MAEQSVIWLENDYADVIRSFTETGIRKLFLVCDNAFRYLRISDGLRELENYGISVVKFDGFTVNPKYEEIVEGVNLFRREECDMIFAVGGGSAIDVAKCIKLYVNMNEDSNYLEQQIVSNEIPLWAMPTTAGTGSEATRYAVIYYNGEKQSVTHTDCIPSVVFMDVSALQTLPVYQKKATMLDAFCHALESFWSVNSNEESRRFSTQAIELILENYPPYLANQMQGCKGMLLAANMAGKAINITQTTAGHAMCYKLTSLYGIAHGHAAALCVSVLWPYLLQHTEECIDPRGEGFLKDILNDIASVMRVATPRDAVERFERMLEELELDVPKMQPMDYDILKKSVNPVRLKNHPVKLTEDVINRLYHRIGEKRKEK